MQFLFLYEIGETPECRDAGEFPDLEAAKAHARQSLEETLAASSADAGSICVGEGLGDDEDGVRWCGAYALERHGEPVWSTSE